MKNKSPTYYYADDVAAILDVNRNKAYEYIKQLNAELADKGYITIAGRVPKKYVKERFYCG